MRLIDAPYLKTPWDGARQLVAVYPRPKTSKSHPTHRFYPYLLRNIQITQPNPVGCADVTYMPMHRGFWYRVAIQAGYSRRVLTVRSNMRDADCCVEALNEALERFQA